MAPTQVPPTASQLERLRTRVRRAAERVGRREAAVTTAKHRLRRLQCRLSNLEKAAEAGREAKRARRDETSSARSSSARSSSSSSSSSGSASDGSGSPHPLSAATKVGSPADAAQASVRVEGTSLASGGGQAEGRGSSARPEDAVVATGGRGKTALPTPVVVDACWGCWRLWHGKPQGKKHSRVPGLCRVVGPLCPDLTQYLATLPA